jgi:hypothetical protein
MMLALRHIRCVLEGFAYSMRRMGHGGYGAAPWNKISGLRHFCEDEDSVWRM